MLIPVNEDFIYKELCKLNPSKSTGTDNIPARFVKDAASVFKKNLLNFQLRKMLFQKIREARLVAIDLSVCCLLYQKSWKELFIHNWNITL